MIPEMQQAENFPEPQSMQRKANGVFSRHSNDDCFFQVSLASLAVNHYHIFFIYYILFCFVLYLSYAAASDFFALSNGRFGSDP